MNVVREYVGEFGCTPLELMATVLARDLADGEMGASGMASAVPTAALLMARRSHAPNLTIGGELSVNPKPHGVFESPADPRYHEGVEAFEDVLDLFGHSHRGLDFFFHSGLQIDAFGNLNLHGIGLLQKGSPPTFRGPGVPNVSFAWTSKRFYIYTDRHSIRRFVEKVDFISIPGNLQGPESKRRARINTEGPRLCVTPLCVFDFHPSSLRMRLKSVHPWSSPNEVRAATGFDVGINRKLPQTALPSPDELELLRQVDVTGRLQRMSRTRTA